MISLIKQRIPPSTKKTLQNPKKLHGVNNATPSTQDISICSRKQDLRDCFFQLLRAQVIPIDSLAHSLHQISSGSGGSEIFRVGEATNGIIGWHIGLPLGIKSGDDRRDEVGSPAVKRKWNY